MPLEILTGVAAGGIAGAITCARHVLKTLIQTELDPEIVEAAKQTKKERMEKKAVGRSPASVAAAATASTSASQQAKRPSTSNTNQNSRQQKQPISTSSPSTTLKRHGHVSLDTESVIKALRIIYKSEGLAGWFRGVGPRFVWTGLQSGTMLVVYQNLLKWFDNHPLIRDEDVDGLRGVH